jgi:integrase
MAKPLTTARLKTLLTKPGRHGDGAGLYFRVLAEDKAYWVYRYRVDGKEREISIGPFPEISLIDARAQHMALRKRVVVDRADPLAEKRAGKEMPRPTGKPSFGEIADAHIEAKGGEWRNARHLGQWEMTLTRYCAPIRNKPVDAIGTSDVLAVLKPLWARTPETASRLRGRIEVVLNRARALGHIDEDRANPARWKGHLDQILPNNRSRTSHHAAMPYAEVPAFVAKLDTPAAKALMFLILTSARADEVLGATWDEVDMESRVWTVPAHRMKMKRLHRVPLSEPAMVILRTQLAARQDGQRHVFPGRSLFSPHNKMALSRALDEAGAGQFTVHGFRSSFRDWAGDMTSFPREVAEAALAHAIGDETERAYRRGDALDKRRALMDAWGAFLEGTESNVVPLARRLTA